MTGFYKGMTAFLGLAATVACGASSSDTSVAMHRGNAQRTGVIASRAIPQPTEALWRISADVGEAPLSVAGQRLYFTSAKGVLRAVDTTTGKMLWSYGTEAEPEKFQRPSSPAVSNGSVYWTNKEGLHALDAETGRVEWRVNSPANGSPILANGVVYFAGTALVAVNAETGQERWRYGSTVPREGKEAVDYIITAGPVLADGIVYVARASGSQTSLAASVAAVDAASGQERWTVRDNAQDGSAGVLITALAIDDSIVYVVEVTGKEIGTLRALDATTGQERWRRSSLGSDLFVGREPVIANGVVYVVTAEASEGEIGPVSIYAIDAATGQERWRHPLDLTGDNRVENELIYVDGTLYVGGGPALIAVDASTGQERWRFKTDEDVFPGPTVSNGVLYFGGSGVLRAVR